jgi:signal transduction histidine kinase
MKTKTKSAAMQNCLRCAEEIRKADRSRKYAHELKNIFITISTVVNAEIESPHQYSSISNISNNASLVVESGDASPFIMEGRKQRNQSKTNSSLNINNVDSPFYFLKTLCDYGKTLIKEINEMGKEYTEKGNNHVEPFNISKAIDFCVDMFDTKRKYDKTKRNLEFSSDINFSYDKMIESISETGLKMVLINLLTNAYKFTIKGKIIVRAVSMPKEKKIRILVKDSGKGFDPLKLTKNGCFYIYERNQDLNVDGSGLGLTIVYEILTKFNIKLEIISNPEKGGSLFYFDLDDSYPYYDEINPQNLMSESLTQIIKDINSGKKDKEYFHKKKAADNEFKINLYSMAKNQSKNAEDNIENEKNNNLSTSKKI